MKRILWMADEIISQMRPSNWERALCASRELFSLIGNPNFQHEVITPQDGIGQLSRNLIAKKFSSIIDLSGGWISESVREIFPATPIINTFHLSRVRDVSDPELHTTGHFVSLNHEKINALSKRFNLSHPLIIDDVSFSGLSSEITMRLFQLDPNETTHGFLITNDGDLGELSGARHRLEILGSHVVAGHTMNTSEGEDGWHIKDFVSQNHLQRLLGVTLIIQELFEKEGTNSPTTQRLFESEAMRQVFFPDALPMERLKKIESEGMFIPNPNHKPKEGSIHTANPTLLISPYILKHISSKRFRENFEHVADLMMEIHELSNNHEEAWEAIAGLRAEVRHSLEGQYIHPERII